MRKIILDLATTLDGFIEGEHGEIDWCIMEEDMEFSRFLDSIDSIFYGRVSYDAWGNYLPEGESSPDELAFWDNLHRKKKYVFSRQEKQDSNAFFIQDDLANRVAAIKMEEGKDIWLYGGASLIKSFIELELIDIYRISIHPIALGKGKPLFENLQNRLNLKLIASHVFKSGVVQLIYSKV